MRSDFENAFAYAPIGMALVDMTGRLLRVNDALCRITGYTAEEICAQPFYDLSDPHDADMDARQIMELLSGRSPAYQVEKRYRHAWGHRVWVQLSVSLVRDDEGGRCTSSRRCRTSPSAKSSRGGWNTSSITIL